MKDLIFEIIISAAVTALSYGVGPFILCKARKLSIKLLYLRIFCISYTVLVWFIWQYLTYGDGTPVRTMPAIFWGVVFYRLAKKSMQKKPTSFTPAIPVKADPVERWYTCPKCGQLVREGEDCDCESAVSNVSEPVQNPSPAGNDRSSKRGKLFLQISILSCALLFACSCGLGFLAYKNHSAVVYLTQVNMELSEKNSKLDDKIKDLNARLTERAHEAREATADSQEWEAKYHEAFDKYFADYMFLNRRIGFIVSGSKYYHSFNCSIFQEADEYWAHNIEYCESLGYSKCPDCFKGRIP